MKKTTAKICTISDIVQWNEKNELQISPKYQRNNVWNEEAKAYLIDTIVRGLPIPPIFLRQKTDVTTKTTYREIIDGQQRIRAILEYIVLENFPIKKSHNKEYGGKRYSDLEPEIQEAILEYEILAEVVIEKDETIVYDMFARLNSNNIVLNKQEIRNSKFWGEFKVLVYQLSSQYRDFFLEQKILSDNDCSRMRDAELITSMLILLLEGITTETPKYIDGIYGRYDRDFTQREIVESQFVSTMIIIQEIYDYFNRAYGCFGNKNYFFTLYCVIVNQMYGIKNATLPRNIKYSSENIHSNVLLLKNAFSQFVLDYEKNIDDKNNVYGLFSEYSEFANNHKTRTTSKNERESRIKFLNNAIGAESTNDNE